MLELPVALNGLSNYHQFIVYRLEPQENGKTMKRPISVETGYASDPHDPATWFNFEDAQGWATVFGGEPEYGVGFVFTENDPFWFLDIDGCAVDGQWSPLATELMTCLAGCAIEISQSGAGLHLIGSGPYPEHSCRNTQLHLEFYTELRFVALTGRSAIGSVHWSNPAAVAAVVDRYFPPKLRDAVEWASGPAEGYSCEDTDGELIARALRSTSAASVFGGGATFADLWSGNEEALARAYPPDAKGVYNASVADAALAQHLAFWTGNDSGRIERLMRQSGLVRDKWEREGYLVDTILFAVSLQAEWYTKPVPTPEGATPFSGSPKQVAFAESVRSKALAKATPEEYAALLAATTPKAFCDNPNATPAALVAATTPTPVTGGLARVREPKLVVGFQYMPAATQVEYFSGCVYLEKLNRILTPTGSLLKSEVFTAVYGGYAFQMTDDGTKTTKNAWECFTLSQCVRFPKVDMTTFRPDLPPLQFVDREGWVLVNSYKPIEVPRVVGNPEPFLKHLRLVLPDPRDQNILLAYMAACVQHKGVKFQWCPLIQGCEGNGKTLFSRCVAEAVGERYTFFPRADQFAEKYNSWLVDKLFVGVEDIYVPESKREVLEILKPMITNPRQSCRAMGVDQEMFDACANFILNSNHRDALQKTRNDRRFAVFYSAQQCEADLAAYGMRGSYFPALYHWLREESGYAIVSEFLHSYAIPEELNPAGACHRAPSTSTTEEAISESLGSIEQEILEAVGQGVSGFAGGWISSVALERLLKGINATRALPQNKRRSVLNGLGYVYHPALVDGRVNNPIAMDDGKKPRLFIKVGHLAANVRSPAEAVRLYQEAQNAASVDVGKATFG